MIDFHGTIIVRELMVIDIAVIMISQHYEHIRHTL